MNIQEYSRSQSEAWVLLEKFMPTIGKGLSTICLKVSKDTGVRVGDIRSATREQPVSRARQLFMHRAHKAGFSLSQIGNFLGGRDHTTVLHGVRVIEAVRNGEKPARIIEGVA